MPKKASGTYRNIVSILWKYVHNVWFFDATSFKILKRTCKIKGRNLETGIIYLGFKAKTEIDAFYIFKYSFLKFKFYLNSIILF